MRWLTAFLLFATPAMAEPLLIAPERVLGVFDANEYAGNDWNRDEYQDLTVIAISQSGDAVDLYLATSDPVTGALTVTDVAYGILPYDPDRIGDVRYEIFPSHETYDPVVGYNSEVSGKSLYIRIGAREVGSDIMDVLALTSTEPGQPSKTNCEIWFVNIFEENFVPHATVLSPDGEETTYNPGAPPLLADWHHTDLPNPCLP